MLNLTRNKKKRADFAINSLWSLFKLDSAIITDLIPFKPYIFSLETTLSKMHAFKCTISSELDSKTEPKCTFSLNKHTCDLHHAHSLTSMQ